MNEIEKERINEIIAELDKLPIRSSFGDANGREIIEIKYARRLEGLIFEARQIIRKLDNGEDYLDELDKLKIYSKPLGAYFDDYDKAKTIFSHILSSVAKYELNINNYASSDLVPLSSPINQQNNIPKKIMTLPRRSISLGVTIISWVISIPWMVYDWQNGQIPFEASIGFLVGFITLIDYFYGPDNGENKTLAPLPTQNVSSGGMAAGNDIDIKGSTIITGQIIMPSKRLSTREEELTQLISPLNAKLNKNDEIIDFMTTYKISRIWKYNESTIAELEKLEENIKEIMLQYGPLASDQLYIYIKTFLNLRPEWEQDNSYEARKVLLDIKKIVKERQDYLRTELKKLQ